MYTLWTWSGTAGILYIILTFSSGSLTAELLLRDHSVLRIRLRFSYIFFFLNPLSKSVIYVLRILGSDFPCIYFLLLKTFYNLLEESFFYQMSFLQLVLQYIYTIQRNHITNHGLCYIKQWNNCVHENNLHKRMYIYIYCR